jgi:hypothetical protein
MRDELRKEIDEDDFLRSLFLEKGELTTQIEINQAKIQQINVKIFDIVNKRMGFQ